MAIEYEGTITVKDINQNRGSISVRRFDLGAVPPIDETYNILDAIIDPPSVPSTDRNLAIVQDFKDQIEARVLKESQEAVIKELEATLVGALTSWEGTR